MINTTHSYTSAKPSWIRVGLPKGQQVEVIRDLKSRKHLHTVCESALCPNIHECWSMGHATFMIMGNGCSRQCAFCGVSKKLNPLEPEEPGRVAEVVKDLELTHAVITSVTRDDLADGGAAHFAKTIHYIKKICVNTTVEVLIPDFCGNGRSLDIIIDAKPEIIGHNMETIRRLYPQVRPQADFDRSLQLLKTIKKADPQMITKSGIMVGLGETIDEVVDVMRLLKNVRVDILTIGQYLRPGLKNPPVSRYYHPDEFEILKNTGTELGFLWVESGPLVRSSYRANQQARYFLERKEYNGRFPGSV